MKIAIVPLLIHIYMYLGFGSIAFYFVHGNIFYKYSQYHGKVLLNMLQSILYIRSP